MGYIRPTKTSIKPYHTAWIATMTRFHGSTLLAATAIRVKNTDIY